MPTLREMSGLAAVCPRAYALTVVRMLRTLAQHEPATFEGVVVGMDAVEEKYGSMDNPEALSAWLDDLGPVLDIDIPEEVWNECDAAELNEETEQALQRVLAKCPATTEEELNEWLLTLMQDMKSDPDVRAALEARMKDVCSLHGLPPLPVEVIPDPVLPPAHSPDGKPKTRSRKRRGRRDEQAAVECALTLAPASLLLDNATKQTHDRHALADSIWQALQTESLTAAEVCDLDAMATRIEQGMREAQRRGVTIEVDRQAIKRSLRQRLEEDGFYIGPDDRVRYRRWSWKRGVRLAVAILAGTWAAITAWMLFWR